MLGERSQQYKELKKREETIDGMYLFLCVMYTINLRCLTRNSSLFIEMTRLF